MNFSSPIFRRWFKYCGLHGPSSCLGEMNFVAVRNDERQGARLLFLLGVCEVRKMRGSDGGRRGWMKKEGSFVGTLVATEVEWWEQELAKRRRPKQIAIDARWEWLESTSGVEPLAKKWPSSQRTLNEQEREELLVKSNMAVILAWRSTDEMLRSRNNLQWQSVVVLTIR
ncbi:hypothetical protein MUK42_10984 [Musa troglodytarum]|uniref:Uncharacterized protein n=1 Tax=Musa troglodytarum TaxID=320322 RepID=A0A9E7GMQ3_9LILI|nr:hypothetical protein MUK42_10984 [Musa troglodytarum]